MGSSATFLHVTDAHLAFAGTPNERDDRKTNFVGLVPQTRELALEQLFERLSEKLNTEQTPLDGIIFSGDAQDRGRTGGHKILLDLLLHYFKPLGISAERIVAVPGNHDVDRAFAPSTPERYKEFCEVWRDGGCVVPWLDGIDINPPTGTHSLVADDASWAIFPINTSNWCHAAAILPTPLADVWDHLPELAAPGEVETQRKIRAQLDSLARYDMARVSEHQLEQLRRLVGASAQPERGRQLRIGVLHHHLRSPSLREEVKAFADISNLEQVRAFLRDRHIDVVVHGHKHEHSAQFDHLYDHAGQHARRMLIISGATFDQARENDAVRLLKFEGLPYVPTVTIEPIAVQRAGVDVVAAAATTRRLWMSGTVPGGPSVVQGTDLDEIYERVVEVAKNEAANGTLVVHLDLPPPVGTDLPLPSTYPVAYEMDSAARQDWLKDLVGWWQSDRSKLEQRMPFVHGSRLRRYGGKIDQIKRIKKLLAAKPSTRALAVLVDPFRDFTDDGTKEEFASFTLVEFKRRELGSGRHAVDAIAFYRAQEFARWWPINVAELRFLQVEIAQALGFTPGRITTITADARTHSRSPAQVAMPIVDRWLDQKPERLHALANVLLQGQARTAQERAVLKEWDRCLIELEEVTEDFNPDGVPVAVEGLEALASYLGINVENDSSLTPLVTTLYRMAEDNRAFEASERDRDRFNVWSARTQSSLTDLREMTNQRLLEKDPKV